MRNSYQDAKTAFGYKGFLNSKDGQIQREILWQFIKNHLPAQNSGAVLDAGCGNGWLSQLLSGHFEKISGCDISTDLIADAKINFPPGEFKIADVCRQLPFAENSFDCVVLNMVAHDLENQKTALVNINRMLKPGGTMILTIINPYYAYPAGQWKRGWKKLLFQKPKLVLTPYNFLAGQNREHAWKKNIPLFFYSLPQTLNTALSAGFNLVKLEEITSGRDSKKFDLNYRLYRYPILLLLKFEKTLQ